MFYQGVKEKNVVSTCNKTTKNVFNESSYTTYEQPSVLDADTVCVILGKCSSEGLHAKIVTSKRKEPVVQINML